MAINSIMSVIENENLIKLQKKPQGLPSVKLKIQHIFCEVKQMDKTLLDITRSMEDVSYDRCKLGFK